MSIELGLYQGPSVTQQLNLAPQLLHWLRLLQAPTVELAALVKYELETNPTLEINDRRAEEPAADLEPFDPADQREDHLDAEPLSFDDQSLDVKFKLLAEIDSEWRDDQEQARKLQSVAEGDEQEKHQFIMDKIASGGSLYHHLKEQLGTSNLSASDARLAELIIGSLDARGYLTCPVAELAQLAGVSTAQVEYVLKQIQTLDPAGIGARDLRECLLLQLQEDNPRHTLAIILLRDHVDLVSCQQFHEIARILRVTEDQVIAARQLLATLDPEPGRRFAAEPTQYIAPDVIVEPRNGELAVVVNNEQIPHLKISASCRRLLEEKQLSSADMAYLRRQMRNATFLIQGIGQRQETLRKVAMEIVRVQREALTKDQGEIVPLTMAAVAQRIGVHETTVSRALANKYIQTPRGLCEMKNFFKAGYRCDDGSAMTPEAVKDIIATLIEQENPALPFTDLQIVQALTKRGLKVARRTVAKYREEMNIFSSKQRMNLSPRRKATTPRPAPILPAASPTMAPPKTAAHAFTPVEQATERLIAIG